DQLTDGDVRRSDLGELAAQPDRGGNGRGGADERPVFEPCEAIGQLVGERHRNPLEDPNANRAANVDPCRSLAARRAWRTTSAVAPWLCVTAFRRLCSEQRVCRQSGNAASLPSVS